MKNPLLLSSNFTPDLRLCYAEFKRGGENKVKWIHYLAYLLLWVGGLNWGLIGLFNYNLVETIFGSWPALIQWVYILAGVSTLYVLFTHKNDCKICSKM